MASHSRRIQAMLMAVCALLASATMLFSGAWLHPVWWMVWFAPLPILLVAPRVRTSAAFGIAALAWFGGGLSMWHYLVGPLHIPVTTVLMILAGPSCVFGLVVLVYRALIRRGAAWQAALSFPMLWVAYGYVTSITSPHGTFANIGYTQMDCLPLLQFASIAGIWGIGFCVFLFPAAAAAVFTAGGHQTKKTGLAVVTAAFLAVVGLYGLWRLHSTPAGEHQVTVVLVASDMRRNPFPEDDADTLRLARDYSAQIDRIAEQLGRSNTAGNDLVIVLPEKIGIVTDEGTKEVDTLFQAAAARARASILVGLDRGTETMRLNEARLYSPQGMLRSMYDKHHLVPHFEDVDRPGTQRTVLHQASGVWGIEICKDMGFPLLSRQYGEEGVGLLLVPAWDFVLDGWLHDRMAVLRGVESGLTIARTAKQGLLTISDDRGRVLAQTSSGGEPFSYLTASVPVWHDNTPYSRWGDWFAWLNIGGLIVMLAALIINRKRE